ncbi:MAG: hypothetical protein M3O36_04400 [Myxococcota bacterium]|nr:hypothetical protein [Myxococcota bacterium]
MAAPLLVRLRWPPRLFAATEIGCTGGKGSGTQLPNLLPKNAGPKVVARVRGDATAADPDRTAAILESLFAYREDLTMDHLAMPIVAVDADLRPVALDHDRAHAPHFDARILEGTSHWLMLDKPSEFAGVLRDAVESIELGRGKRRPIGHVHPCGDRLTPSPTTPRSLPGTARRFVRIRSLRVQDWT